ncbi:MAG: hypothetical protein RL095_4196 [Verrucomicrobiota bacterium]|jgi:hypothetical protein
MLPLLALWILCLGLYTGWLRQQEEYYGARDTLMDCSPSGFSTFEAQMVRKFRAELLRCWPAPSGLD